MDQPCTDCGGQGRRQQNRKLSVDVPKGIEDGTRIRLANEGEAGLRGGPPGDLYIFVSIKPHDLFQRDGADLYARVPIAMTTAALGGEFEVPTLDGARARSRWRRAPSPASACASRARACRCCGRTRPAISMSSSTSRRRRTSRKRQRELLEEFEKLATTRQLPDLGFVLRQAQGPVRAILTARGLAPAGRR